MLSLFLTISLRHNSESLIDNEPSYNVVLVHGYISIKSSILSIEFLVSASPSVVTKHLYQNPLAYTPSGLRFRNLYF